jgi:hypothetical protein
MGLAKQRERGTDLYRLPNHYLGCTLVYQTEESNLGPGAEPLTTQLFGIGDMVLALVPYGGSRYHQSHQSHAIFWTVVFAVMLKKNILASFEGVIFKVGFETVIGVVIYAGQNL